MRDLTPSDYALIVDLVLAVVLALYFALGPPRVWFRDRLGWVIFSYAIATVALLGLMVYRDVFGQRADETIRFGVGAALAVALAGKLHRIYSERRAGRHPGERQHMIDKEKEPKP